MSLGIPFRGRLYRGRDLIELASLIEHTDPCVKPNGQPDPNMDLMRAQLNSLIKVLRHKKNVKENSVLFMAILQSPAFDPIPANFPLFLHIFEEWNTPGIAVLVRKYVVDGRLDSSENIFLLERLADKKYKGVEFVVEAILLYTNSCVYFDCKYGFELLPAVFENEMLFHQLLRAFELKRLFFKMDGDFPFWACSVGADLNQSDDFILILFVMLAKNFNSVTHASFDCELLRQFLDRQRTKAEQMKKMVGPLQIAQGDSVKTLAALRLSFGTVSDDDVQRSGRDSMQHLERTVTSLATKAEMFKAHSVRLTRHCDKFMERMQTAFVGIVVALHQANMPVYITERLMREAGFAFLFLFPSEHQRVSAIQRVFDSCRQRAGALAKRRRIKF
jgi:hypothetical protein